MKNLIFILFSFYFLIFRAEGASVFPDWFSPDTAKMETLKEFILEMEKKPEMFYKILFFNSFKFTDEEGHEAFSVDISFLTPECLRSARQEWKSYLCNQNKCKPFPFHLLNCDNQI